MVVVRTMPKKKKRTLIAFAFIILLLYAVIGIVPSLTGALTGTELVEYGNLQISDDATCYIIRDETIYTAAQTGDMDPYIEEGTQIKKGTDLFAFTPTEEPAAGESLPEEEAAENGDSANGDGTDSYLDLVSGVQVNIAEDQGFVSQRKGVVSYHVDGYEDYFAFSNLLSISRADTEALEIESRDIKRKSCSAGEPIYKICNNSEWYILFWVDQEAIARYEVDRKVTARLNGESIPATVISIQEDESGWQVILQTNRYYSGFAKERVIDGTIINTDISGLLVSNHCLTKKDGVIGVYVRTKTGDYHFTPVEVKVSNGEQTVLTEGQFTDSEGNLVNTVKIYDEVLADPQNAEKVNGL